MDPARLFDELLGIAARTALEVRTRTFRGKVQGKVPFAGGSAKRWPMTEKRKRAQRS